MSVRSQRDEHEIWCPRAPQKGFLWALNPLSKIAAVFPAWLGLFFTRDILTPLLLIGSCLLLLALGGSLRLKVWGILLVGIPSLILVMGVSFGAWIDPYRVQPSEIMFSLGSFTYTEAMLRTGIATSSRLLALGVVSLMCGLTTQAFDLSKSLGSQLRIPYRFGYTAVAAARFLPRFRHELRLIRAAQRIRGVGSGAGIRAWWDRTKHAAVPVLAASIRHAERVALSMESRGFGAYHVRTERSPLLWRRRDTVFLLFFWCASVLIFML